MAFVQLLKQFRKHPLTRGHELRALRRAVAWQISSRLAPGKIEYPFIGPSRLLIGRGMVGATGNLYYGLHEFEDMSLVLHALRAEDLFVDVGANVGAYTVLAGAVAGARVHAFEPIPHTFAQLVDNIRLNDLSDRVQAINAGVGAEHGVLRFTSGFDAVNHVASPDVDGPGGKLIEVPVVPLDSLGADARPAIIKIDVEGYETRVIQGAARLLESTSLLAVIMELNGSGTRYGFDELALHRQMIERGFQWCTYAPAERAVRKTPDNAAFGLNNLYVRDIHRLQERVRTAPSFRVLGMEF